MKMLLLILFVVLSITGIRGLFILRNDAAPIEDKIFIGVVTIFVFFLALAALVGSFV